MKKLKSSLRQVKPIINQAKRKFSYWKLQNLEAPSSFLGLTYANDKKTDGAGAQLQRIYGIYALSRLLKVPYIHSPLIQVNYQGLAALESNSSDQSVADKYNQVFSIPSDVELPDQYEIRDLKKPDLETLIQLKQEAEKKQTFILARLVLPYGVTDVYPETYAVVKEVSPFSTQASSVIRVAVHVRRGELFVVDPSRMLPNEYYIATVQRIIKILEKLNLSYQVELYTEVPTKAFTVTPSHQGIDSFYKIPDQVIVDPKANKIEEFDAIPNLKKFINTDPIETLQGMASADILVTSHSSFSYLSSILNPKEIIIYHKFWHNPLKNWIVADDSGDFSEDRLIQQLQKIG